MSETFTVEAFGVGIVVVVDDGTRTEDVRARLPPGWRPVHPDGVPVERTYRLRFDGTRDPPAFRRDDGPELFCKHDLALLDAFEHDAKVLVAERSPRFAFVHAGAVAWHGGAWLFPGTSHAGKTSLVRALVAHGATYLSDDVALLDDDGHARPYASAMSVRTGAGERIRESPASAASPETSFPVVGIVLTGYAPDAVFDPRPLPRERALLALVHHAMSVQFSPERTMARLGRATVGARHFLEGRRGDAAFAANLLRKLAVASADEEASAGRA